MRGKVPWGLDGFDVIDQKAVVEANARIGLEQIFANRTDSNFRNLHVQSTVTASTRRLTFSNDFVFCTYPAKRAMTAHEPAIATVNQMMPRSGQPNRFSFHMETKAKTTQGTPRNTISQRLKAIIVSWGCIRPTG